MKNKYIVSLLVAPVALSTAAWRAQADEVANPFSARVGLGVLSDGDTRDALGSPLLTGGLSYQFSQKSRVDLDYLRATEDGDKLQALGLMYLQLFKLHKNKNSDGESNNSHGWYAGLGLGVFRVSARAEGDDGPDAPPYNPYEGYDRVSALGDLSNSGDGFNETKTRLGGKALIGYNFNDHFFSELAYTRIGKVEGADPSNLSLSLGIRF